MEKKKDVTSGFYSLAYILFVLLAIYQIFGKSDLIDAASSMGIAMIFDPFHQSVAWKERPFWQKAWMIIHLTIALSLLVYGISIDKI